MSAPMTKEEIAAVLADHLKWLRGEGGKRADMWGANMWGANMRGANMRNADMRGAYLAGAYLARADLAGAYLARADLTGAYLAGASLDGAKINDKTALGILRRATRADGYEFFLWHCQEGFFIAAGCHFFTMAEARQHWTATRAGTPLGYESLDILDFFDAAIKRKEASQ